MSYTVTLNLPEAFYQQLYVRSQQSQRSLETELLSLLMPPVPEVSHLSVLPMAYQEVIAFLGRGATSTEIVNFRLSPQAQARAKSLLQKNRDQTLTPSDNAELDFYVELENFMALLKMQALQQFQPL